MHRSIASSPQPSHRAMATRFPSRVILRLEFEGELASSEKWCSGGERGCGGACDLSCDGGCGCDGGIFGVGRWRGASHAL
eukprot:1984746-Pleurochrysis_carterae.AAC.1